MKKIAILFTIVSVLVILPKYEAISAVKTWKGSGGGSWTINGNWTPSGVPVSGDDIIISADVSSPITNVPSITLNSITVNGTCTFSSASTGNTLIITNSFTVSANETFTTNLNLTLANTPAIGTINGICIVNSSTFTNSGTLTISSSSYIGGSGTFTNSTGATLKIGSQAGITTTTASGNIQVTGTRTFSAGANYEYFGSANQVTGTGLTQSNPANLTINNPGNTVTLTSSINITGLLTISSGSTLSLGANALGTPTSIEMECGTNAGSSITGTGTLTLGGDININNLQTSTVGSIISCPIALGSATRTFNLVNDGVDVNDLLIDGIISGTGTAGINKTGSGLLLLAKVNTYSGTTTIEGGTIRLGVSANPVSNNGPLGSSSETFINSGASLDLYGYDQYETLNLQGTGYSETGALRNDNSLAPPLLYTGTVILQNSSSIGAIGDLQLSYGLEFPDFDLTKVGTGSLTLGGANSTFGNLTISGGSLTIPPEAQVTVINHLINNGNLNLQSSPVYIASLMFNSFSGTGSTNIQVYLTGSDVTWHYISSPFTSLLAADVVTSGEDADASDLAAYNEPLVATTGSQHLAWVGYDGWDYTNWVSTSNTFDNLEVGRGYNYSSYSEATRVLTGTPNTGSVQRNLSYSSVTDNLVRFGWNLVGNPYTSCILWDDVARTASVDAAIYFTNEGSYAVYVDEVGIPEGTNGMIPPMQGFFVKANTTGQSITMDFADRHHSLQNRYKGEKDLASLIRLKIGNNVKSDETVIRFNEKAMDTFDQHLDAYKFSKTDTYLSLFTTTGDISYSINSIPFPEKTVEIPVGMYLSKAGTYNITASSLQSIENYKVILTDKNSGLTFDLKTSPSVSFTSKEGMISDRFIITITNLFTGIEEPVLRDRLFKIYSNSEFIIVEPLSDEWEGKSGSINLVDLTGRNVSILDNTEFHKNSQIQIPVAGKKGIYFVKIKSGLMNHIEKILLK